MKNQTELFNYIWETRPHFSELSGKPLLSKTHPQWHWQFIHVLPKGKYSKYKLNPDNILLGLPEEHEKQNNFEVFNQRYEELHRRYYQEIYQRSY